MKKHTFYKIKVFTITFLISLLVFGAMFAGTYYFVIMRNRATEELVTQVPKTDSYHPDSKDNLSVVLITCPQRNQPPASYFLLRFDVVNARCSVVEVPSGSIATLGVKTKTIDEHYTYGGMETAAQAVGNLFLLDTSYYIRLDFDTMQKFADFFSGITYYVPAEITTDDYVFQEGRQLLDGRRMSSLMFSGSFTEKADLLSSFLAAHFDSGLTNNLDRFYDLIFNQSDTNLNRAIFNELDKPVHYFLRHGQIQFLSFTLQGEATDKGLVLDRTQLDSLRSQLSEQKIT